MTKELEEVTHRVSVTPKVGRVTANKPRQSKELKKKRRKIARASRKVNRK